MLLCLRFLQNKCRQNYLKQIWAKVVLMLWLSDRSNFKYLHLLPPVSMGVVTWYCNHSAAIWKASWGAMRHALLTRSPWCARKAARYDKSRGLSVVQTKNVCLCKFTRLTNKERIKVAVTVKVNPRVYAAGAVIFWRKSSLKGKIKKGSGYMFVMFSGRISVKYSLWQSWSYKLWGISQPSARQPPLVTGFRVWTNLPRWSEWMTLKTKKKRNDSSSNTDHICRQFVPATHI